MKGFSKVLAGAAIVAVVGAATTARAADDVRQKYREATLAMLREISAPRIDGRQPRLR